jgi:hypothetical protein
MEDGEDATVLGGQCMRGETSTPSYRLIAKNLVPSRQPDCVTCHTGGCAPNLTRKSE